MNRIFQPSNVETDFLVARLRTQVDNLCEVIVSVEADLIGSDSRIYESIKAIESELKKTRKYVQKIVRY